MIKLLSGEVNWPAAGNAVLLVVACYVIAWGIDWLTKGGRMTRIR